MKTANENKLNDQNLTFDSRQHAFNVGIAQDFGIHIALFLGHLAFWSEKNLANNKHIHDGLVWCYDTLEAMRDYFPYFSKRQVEHMIKKCIEAGLVVSGNYNKNGYDRTCWYALTEKSYFYFPHLEKEKYKERRKASSGLISQNCEMEITKLGNGNHKNVTPIPDTDPDPDPKRKNIKKESDKKSLFEQFWKLHPVKKSKKSCQAVWKRKNLETIGEIIIEKFKKQLENDISYKSGYIHHPLTYLNQERWTDEIYNPEQIKNKNKEKEKKEAAERMAKQELHTEKMRKHQLMKQDEIKNSIRTKQPNNRANGSQVFSKAINDMMRHVTGNN